MNKRQRTIALAKLEARSVKNGCWTWHGTKLKGRGYGVLHIPGVGTRSVHRASWEAHNGPIPPYLLVCHHCDNPACWNPEHLFLGTHADNVRDGRGKGRGPGNSTAAMNMQKAEAMRRLWDTGKVDKHEIARRFGVSWALVNGVTSGQTWRLT